MSKCLLNYILMGCFFMLSSCSLLGPVKTPNVNIYTLTAKNAKPSKHVSSPQQGVLLISTPTASPGLETSHIIYIEKPYQFNQFAYSRWVAPPASMLTPLLLQSIENSGCFSAVVTAPFTGSADANLQINVTTLQQEFVNNISRVRLNVSVTLTDAASEQITQQRFEAVTPTTANNPYAGVVAANEAVAVILKKINRLVCKNR